MEIKYNIPNKLTSKPKGTIFKVLLDYSGDTPPVEDTEYQLYIQTSSNENDPEWLKLGDFLEEAFEHKITSEHFIKDTLILFDESRNKKDSK